MLNCDADQAFKQFTNNEDLEVWLAMRADVEPKVQGKYELFWRPEDPQNDSTIGCKIKAIDPGRLLSFNWKGPEQFKAFMNESDPLTHVTISFIPQGTPENPETEVHLIHSGWGSSPDWQEAKAYFDRAWGIAFGELEKKVNVQ
jgi:uncharacterized protein YndB with AHSA1/START domain